MATEFVVDSEVSSFRQIASAMWGRPSDPSIYGSMDVDVTDTLRFIEQHRQRSGKRLTITHVVARAVAQAFKREPKLNAKVRYWGRVERRKSVDLFVSVATEGGKDLSGVRIDGAEDLSLDGLVDAVTSSARDIRSGNDAQYQKSRNTFRSLPWWAVRPMLRVTDLLTNELHLDLASQGAPRDPFGTALITNVGPFGIDTAFAPFVPLARCPMLLLLSEIKERPVVVPAVHGAGRVVARPVLRLCATFDHRIIDGYSAGKLARHIRSLVENPGQTAAMAEAA